MAFPDGWLHVHNWEKYQTIQHGKPAPWIKSYPALLNDPQFMSLSRADRYDYLAILWLAGIQTHTGWIPFCNQMVAKRIQGGRHLDLQLFIDKGLLETNSGMTPEQTRLDKTRQENPPLNKHIPPAELKPKISKKKRPVRTSVVYSPEFEEFWVCYPRKVGKGAAWKSWCNAGINGNFKALIASVEKHKSWEQWSSRQYIPHPATFISQRRWEDGDEQISSKIRDEDYFPELKGKSS